MSDHPVPVAILTAPQTKVRGRNMQVHNGEPHNETNRIFAGPQDSHPKPCITGLIG